jgi:indoleamine 2,3-dioxygenase
MVLAWLVNFYVHSIPPPDEEASMVVPQSLAVPLVKVSKALGIAPVLTFADTVLWNWELVNPGLPTKLENMRITNLFSGTDDERNFYAVSVRAELQGVEIIHVLENYHSLPNITDITSISRISRDLFRLAELINDIGDIIQSVKEACDPHVFYRDIRPWLEGSDAKGPTSLGWIYEGVSDSAALDLSGPSGGQSGVIHALDVFLDVDHKLQYRRSPAPSESNRQADRGFMERMTRYMPGSHRQYLNRLAATPRPIRDLVQRTPSLREPYNSAVKALKRLRDVHMRIACYYIVTMSRSTETRPGCPVSAAMERMTAKRTSADGVVRGTGGNEVSKLLKAGRDATRRTIIGEY